MTDREKYLEGKIQVWRFLLIAAVCNAKHGFLEGVASPDLKMTAHHVATDMNMVTEDRATIVL